MEQKLFETELFNLILARSEMSKIDFYDLVRQYYIVNNIEKVTKEEQVNFPNLQF
ncbi:MAG: hypothetical protein MJZ66_09810 [Bacteroidales bacterium]|nr:hypothetical protein [Bacteroidales bacterium]